MSLIQGNAMAINDNSAVSVLLARYFQALEMRDIEQKVIADANARLAQHGAKVLNFRSAFSAFGFDVTEKGVWTRMANQIGGEAYHQALLDAKAAACGNPLTTSIKTTAGTDYVAVITTSLAPELSKITSAESAANTTARDAEKRDDVRTAEDGEQAAEDEDAAIDEGAIGGVAPEVAETVTPKVRDAVLERLKLSGSSGLKATELRQYYENAFATKLHEKTIGMTLYRLSKDDLVRRDGRLWFYVPLKGETKNPGGGTPGLIGMDK
jgi:hypothetical protein